MTTDPECPVCGAALYDTQTICNACRNRLETCLLETGPLWRDLDVTLCKQSQTRQNNASTELDPTPTVFHVGASNTGQALRATLAAWCSLIQDQTGTKYPWQPTPVYLAAYILHHIYWLAQHAAAPDAYNEITEAYRDVERVIDVDPSTRIIGVCGNDTDTGPCTQTLWAHTYAAAITCKACGALWDVRSRRLESYAQAFITAADAPTITRVFETDGIAITAHRIAVWANRGLLAPVWAAGTTATRQTSKRYVVAHVARLVQLSEAGVKLTAYETEVTQ